MPLTKRRRSWNRLKDQYFIWLLRRRYRWWRKEVPRREQAGEPLGVWLYLIKKFVLERTNYFTPANLVSLCRGLLAYPMYLLFMEGYYPAAILVFTVALATDFFDGHLARSFDQETPSGKLGDPLFDKVLIITLVVALVRLDVMPAWMALAIVGLDAFLVVMAMILKPLVTALGITRETGANEYGKWKFTAQCVSMAFFLFALLSGAVTATGQVLIASGMVTGCIALVLAAGSIVEHAFPGCLRRSPDNLVRTLISSPRTAPVRKTIQA